MKLYFNERYIEKVKKYVIIIFDLIGKTKEI